MKTILTAAACVLCFSLNAQYNKENLTVTNHETASKFTYKNMRIYPVLANETFRIAHKNIGKYTALKDAMEKKKVSITEATSQGRDGAQVNKLFIQNTSNDTVIILGGEVVTGGKQDRVIAGDVIIPPKSDKIDISVFCVEQGRWSSNGTGNSFVGCYDAVSTKVRKSAAVDKNQSKVWQEVAGVTGKHKSTTSTGTYAALKDNTDYTTQVAAYKAFFKTILASDQKIIGLVAVSGDSILGCDMFATHDLLIEHSDKLINSYATEAITSGKEVTLAYEKVKSYMDNILADETRQEKLIEENGTMLKQKDSKLHIAVY